jgi:signal transduction histidine kinase
LAFCDIALVERVLQNLLDNAVKFSENGSLIEIHISDDQDKIKFSIADQGKGIADSKIDSIFDRYITEGEEGSKIKGTGLGLAIAKKIMELHGSSINVKSRLNVGTTFSFFLQNNASRKDVANSLQPAY